MRQLDHSPADVVRYLLLLKGLGSLPTNNQDWPIYTSFEPDSPDEVITVFDTSGLRHGRTMIDGEVQQHYGFQIRVRSLDHPLSWARADLIRATIAEKVKNQDVNIGTKTYLVHAISRIGTLVALGREVVRFGMDPSSTKRNIFTMNAVVSLRQVS